MPTRPLLIMLALAAACTNGDASRPPTRTDGVARGDSQYSPAAMVAALQTKLGPPATSLDAAAAPSRDSLIARYVHAVERADTAALDAMRMSEAEFAAFYYLASPMAQKPYELDPDVMWLQMTAQSNRGLSRALQRYGGHSLGAWRASCPTPATRGVARIAECTLAFRPAGANDELTLPLAVVEHGGRYKFVGYGNPL